MILRPDGDGRGVVAIGQASHAWLAGQLARAWGNERFAAPEPREEVVLGAVQHDIGMAAWDLRPERHPDTGLPRQFFELDRRTHLALWTAAPERVLSQSRYAALLVSLHGTGLYERFPPKTDDPGILRAVDEYLGGQRALQEELTAQLGVADDELARNRALVAVWDDLSLALCRDERGPHAGPGAPATAAGAGSVRVPLTLTRSAPDTYTLDPWPFAAPHVVVRAEGRRLDGPSADEPALHAALDRAPVLTVEVRLEAPG
ncbi:hypothetical protein DSM104299_01227 [Baekduia alba]|uniref:DUF3891 family protein n=1 Tax=Baekduia alba TaxID=2997333 RepID=UPI0023423661|nr:DUF3891 family protein [Baekduia alba]WCB92531.1 hypothetical protein DSM104299_01227 [Baekduia alba]